MKYDVITFGSALRDVFLEGKGFRKVQIARFGSRGAECFPFGGKVEVENVTFDMGGGGANSATTFARLGFKTAAALRVGCDGAGHIMKDSLQTSGVDTSFVTTDKKLATGYSTVLLAPSGERTVLVYRGASRVFDPRHVSWKHMSAKWLYVSSVGGDVAFLRRVFRHAKEIGAKVAWNPGGMEIGKGAKHLSVLFPRCEYFQLNRSEAAKLTKQNPENIDRILTKIADFGIPYVAVTDGKAGAYMLAEGVWHFAPSVSGSCVNATGSGDAFGSGFVSGLLHSGSWGAAFATALHNAAAVVCKMGAQHGLLKKFPSKRALGKVKMRQV